jgi:electron transfer flavoprotein alpha subunit
LDRQLSELQLAELSAFGADKFYGVPGITYVDQAVALLCRQIEEKRPFALFIPATSQGKVLAPRIAARLNLGLTGDCVGFEIDSENRLVHIKPAFGGNVLAPIYCRTFPQFATVRPGALPTMTPRPPAKIPSFVWEIREVQTTSRLVERKIDAGKRALKLENSEIVIGIGMGVGQENIPLAFHLAELWNAGVGATRRVVDSGWMERQFQVGLTGRFIAPRIYLALGIGGRANHTIGIRKSNKIIAVNQDRNAEIFKVADFGFVADSVQVLQELIRLSEK